MKKRHALKHTLLASVAVLGLTCVNVSESVAKGSDDSYTSYNPTEPEVQLGYAKIKTMSIDESGTITINKKINIQGSIDSTGNVFIEGVKRPKIFRFDDGDKLTLYYFLDKSGDIFSMNLKNDNYLEDSEGNQTKIELVKSIEGTNGVADKDGFKSNLVPEKFLPKTGLDTATEETKKEEKTEVTYSKKTMITAYCVVGLSILLMLIELLVKRKMKGSWTDD